MDLTVHSVSMGSGSSSYTSKTIYLDVDGKVQKVSVFNVLRNSEFKLKDASWLS